MKEKECPHCHRFLPLSKFNKDKNTKDGLSCYCRKCLAKKSREYMRRWVEDRLQKINISNEIECARCHRFLPSSMFNKRKRKKSGLSSICRDCDSKRNKEYRERVIREIKKGQRKIIIPSTKKCRECKRVFPSTEFTKDIVSRDGLSSYCKECEYKRNREYQKRPEAKERKKQYSKEYRRRPEVKLKQREYYIKYSRKPEYKQRKREYNRRPDVKRRKKKYTKKYLAKPGVKERIRQYQKKYNSKPEVKIRRKEYLYNYLRRPDVKERIRKYKKEYRQRPRVKKRLKQQRMR
jgi:hypothetical protein